MSILRGLFGKEQVDPVPPELHEASHCQANEAMELTETLRRACRGSDPLGDMVRDMQRGGDATRGRT